MGQNLTSDFNRPVVCRLGRNHLTPNILLLFGIPRFVGIFKSGRQWGVCHKAGELNAHSQRLFVFDFHLSMYV
jgi:hypothetical protein